MRARGKEAGDKLQHLTQVNPRKAGLIEASVLPMRRPISNHNQNSIGEGGGRTLVILTSRELRKSALAVGSEKETTTT